MNLTLAISTILYFTISMATAQQITLENKEIPENIKAEVMEALRFYPALYDAKITFKFKDHIKKSTMQAQPTVGSFFRSRRYRSYNIFISRKIQIENESFTISDIPSDVIVGWIGHELGHLMDYRDRSNIGMIFFGIKYLFSSGHIQEVERAADTYAIAHGMGDYILKTKNFILDNAHLSEKYKQRIRNLYISPEEVMELINQGNVEEETDAMGLQ